MSVITLTTDFGMRDWFVGTMKGVILSIDPRARIVDLTHEIPPGDIRAGAFALASGCQSFPEGTIHVAVVDPGVGSPRRAIAARTGRFTFVGPDNGLLSLALARENVKTVRLLENPKLLARTISRTFHGRDIFAPVAAHLGRGIGFRKVGPRAGSYVQLDWPDPVVTGGEVQGEIVYIDRFGNGITNIPASLLPADLALHVRLRGRHLCRVEPCYAAARAGRAVAVIGSTGHLEIGLNGGSGQQGLGLEVADAVSVVYPEGGAFMPGI